VSPRGVRGERALVPEAEFRTYYDRPVLKEPVWTWEVPAYFFVGGLAAGSAMAAGAADLAGDARQARRHRVVATAGALAGAGLLVSDLGRPERFHHMLRVAKPTSPLSVGSWSLAVFGPATGAAMVTDLLGVFPRVRRLAGGLAAALAPVVATYTAVLLSDTAVPVWHEARRELPFLFAGGAAAATGALGVVLDPVGRAGPSRRLMLLGVALEAAGAQQMARSLGREQAEPLRTGRAGRISWASLTLTVVGAGLVVLGGCRRRVAVVGGAAVLAGAALARFAIVEGGRASARDPRYTVRPQRARLCT
jgi:formate-dependent nitrite reductase membrane component NrfD